jgi:hypothetical protein
VVVSPRWDEETPNTVTFQWKPQAGATQYRVYTSTNLGKPLLVATTTGTEATVRVAGRVYWWVEADLGLCGTRRSWMGLVRAPEGVPRRRSVRH